MRKVVVLSLILVSIMMLGAVPEASAASNPPTVVNSFSGQDSAATTSHVIPISSGRGPGDLTVICDDFNVQTTAITWPPGWTLIVQNNAGADASNGIFSCAYRFTVLGDPDSVTVTTAAPIDSTWVGYVIIGVDTSQRLFASAVQANNANPDPPSVTVTVSTSLVVAAYGWGNSAFATQTAYPTGYGANPIKNDAHVISSASAAMSTKYVGAGTENPGTATLDVAAAWAATTIVIAPPVTTATSDLWLLLLLMFFWLLVFALSEDADNPIYIVAFSVFTVALGILLAIQVDVVVANSILSVTVAGLAVFMFIRGVFRVVGEK